MLVAGMLRSQDQHDVETQVLYQSQFRSHGSRSRSHEVVGLVLMHVGLVVFS